MKQANNSVSVEKISFADHNLLKNLCGEHDKHLRLIEKLEPVKVKAWGNNVTISGKNDNVLKISNMLQRCKPVLKIKRKI